MGYQSLAGLTLSDYSLKSRGRDQIKSSPWFAKLGVRDGLITHPFKTAIKYGNFKVLCDTWLKEEHCKLKMNRWLLLSATLSTIPLKIQLTKASKCSRVFIKSSLTPCIFLNSLSSAWVTSSGWRNPCKLYIYNRTRQLKLNYSKYWNWQYRPFIYTLSVGLQLPWNEGSIRESFQVQIKLISF